MRHLQIHLIFFKSPEGPIDYLMRLLVLEIALSESDYKILLSITSL